MRARVKVIRSFPYLDGNVSRVVAVGEDEIAAEHVDGLVANGFIERLGQQELLPPAGASEVPPAPRGRRSRKS